MSKKGRGAYSLGGLCCELYVVYAGVKGITVVEELLGVFCLVDDKGVIHIPKPSPGRMMGDADRSSFKVLHEQASNQ